MFGTRDAEGRKALAQHGVLPSLAGGERPGRCNLYYNRRSVPPALTGAAQPQSSAASIWLFQLLLRYYEMNGFNWSLSLKKSHLSGGIIACKSIG
jgi:hypothetical protein